MSIWFISSQIGMKQAIKKKKKKITSHVPFLPDLGQSIPKKNSKKFKKVNKKNIIMASFLVKLDMDRPKKRRRKKKLL